MKNGVANIESRNAASPAGLRDRLRAIGALLLASLCLLQSATVLAQDEPTSVPPRIGMISGAASFWRPGAEDWSAAQVNTPLAEGDSLYTAAGTTLELQIGARAYLRLAQKTTLTLLSDEAELQQYKITSGTVALDIRNLSDNRTIEIDTPGGAVEIDSAGYYRLDIDDDETHVIVRRAGEAIVTLPDGRSRLIAPSQEAVVENDDDEGDVDTYAAPEEDAWDTWNLARTDDLVEAVSNRYVSPDMYGTDDLDRHGDWRTTSEYGAVWVPTAVAADWAPYSTGSWVWDPRYQWTWVDAAPWGWAPYHYGRWVHLNGYWGWAPGPRLHRPAYAPALVAFFRHGGASISWVALGWGEPCLPWWGRSNFVGRPWWGGWSGPRHHARHGSNASHVHYSNLRQRNAVMAVAEHRFGHGRAGETRRMDSARFKEFRAVAGQLPGRPRPQGFAPSTVRGEAPAAHIVGRPTIELHRPRQRGIDAQTEMRDRSPRAAERRQSNDGGFVRRSAERAEAENRSPPLARFGAARSEDEGMRRVPDAPRTERGPRRGEASFAPDGRDSDRRAARHWQQAPMSPPPRVQSAEQTPPVDIEAERQHRQVTPPQWRQENPARDWPRQRERSSGINEAQSPRAMPQTMPPTAAPVMRVDAPPAGPQAMPQIRRHPTSIDMTPRAAPAEPFQPRREFRGHSPRDMSGPTDNPAQQNRFRRQDGGGR